MPSRGGEGVRHGLGLGVGVRSVARGAGRGRGVRVCPSLERLGRRARAREVRVLCEVGKAAGNGREWTWRPRPGDWASGRGRRPRVCVSEGVPQTHARARPGRAAFPAPSRPAPDLPRPRPGVARPGPRRALSPPSRSHGRAPTRTPTSKVGRTRRVD